MLLLKFTPLCISLLFFSQVSAIPSPGTTDRGNTTTASNTTTADSNTFRCKISDLSMFRQGGWSNFTGAYTSPSGVVSIPQVVFEYNVLMFYMFSQQYNCKLTFLNYFQKIVIKYIAYRSASLHLLWSNHSGWWNVSYTNCFYSRGKNPCLTYSAAVFSVLAKFASSRVYTDQNPCTVNTCTLIFCCVDKQNLAQQYVAHSESLWSLVPKSQLWIVIRENLIQFK